MSNRNQYFENEIEKLFIKALVNASSVTERDDFNTLIFILNTKIEHFDRILPGVEITRSGAEVIVTITGDKSAELRKELLTRLLVKEAFAQSYVRETDDSNGRSKTNINMTVPLARLKIGDVNDLTQLKLNKKPANWGVDLAKAASYCGLALHDHKLNLNNDARSVVSELILPFNGR